MKHWVELLKRRLTPRPGWDLARWLGWVALGLVASLMLAHSLLPGLAPPPGYAVSSPSLAPSTRLEDTAPAASPIAQRQRRPRPGQPSGQSGQSGRPGQPSGQQRQPPSDEQEVALGREIDAALKQDGLVIYTRNRDIVNYVDSIGQRLAAQSERPTLTYTVQVVDDPEINAFATVGGFVYINTGLIAAARNEAELAGVIAHEIGHIEGRHTLRAIFRETRAERVAQQGSPERQAQINQALETRLLAFGREDEYDADTRGYHTLGRTGYSPQGYIDFMVLLDTLSADQPEFLSTHPDPGNRVASLNQLAATSPYPNATNGLDATAYQARIARL